jgi:T-box protein 20
LTEPQKSRLFAEKLVETAGGYESSLSSDSAFSTPKPDDDLASPESVSAESSSGSKNMVDIHCRLETKELWDKFHDLGTEMIITKSGR